MTANRLKILQNRPAESGYWTTMNRTMIIAAKALLVAAFCVIAVFGLSYSQDQFVCHSCKSLGKSGTLRLFGCRTVRSSVEVTRSLTKRQCRHHWQWYTASSSGILMNREDWDGPIGAMPYQDEFAAQTGNSQVRDGR